MLGKAICEISALNKKAVGVPDSSMLIPRAKSCALRGQELVCWRSQLEQAQAPGWFTIKLISLTTIFTNASRKPYEDAESTSEHSTITRTKSSCRSQHQNMSQRLCFLGLALCNTVVSHNTLRLRLPDVAAQLKTNRPTNKCGVSKPSRDGLV